jgi:hypothetical protein
VASLSHRPPSAGRVEPPGTRPPCPLGVVGLAAAPEEATGSAAVLLAAGALPLTRTIGAIWVNRQTGSHVRATVHSLLAQASALGEVACGLAVAAVAGSPACPWRW